MGFLRNLIGTAAGEVIESVGNTVDRFITTDEERLEARLAMRELELRFKQIEMDAEQALLQDRQSARAMYRHDSSLQKVYGVLFLAGYLVLTGALLWWIFARIVGNPSAVDLPNWATALLGSIWTGMSTKVNTITDFLFGGSKNDTDSRDVALQFQKASGPNGGA